MLIKLTQEHCKARNQSWQDIKRGIQAGVIKGKVEPPPARTTWIDDSEVTGIIPSVAATNPIENAEVDAYDKKIALVKKQMELDEVIGKRDLPEVLKQRELAVVERENKVTLDANKLVVDRAKLDFDIQNFKDERQTVGDINTAIEAVLNEYDVQIIQRQDELDRITRQIQSKKNEQETMTKFVSEYYVNEVQPLLNQVKQYIKVANQQATNSYRAGQVTKGQTADYHMNNANNLWGIETKLKNILNSLWK